MKAGVGHQGTRGAGGASVSGGTWSTEVRVAVRKVGAPRKITTEKCLMEKSRKNKGDGVSLGSRKKLECLCSKWEFVRSAYRIQNRLTIGFGEVAPSVRCLLCKHRTKA